MLDIHFAFKLLEKNKALFLLNGSPVKMLLIYIFLNFIV